MPHYHMLAGTEMAERSGVKHSWFKHPAFADSYTLQNQPCVRPSVFSILEV